MITVTIFRSVVDDTKETKRLENPIKIKDVFPDDDFSNSIISVNGFLQDSDYLLEDNDICAIRLFPEGNGADWLAGLGIGLVAAFAVLNFWNPGGWATAAILAGGAAVGALGFGIASAAGWSVTEWLAGLGAQAQDMKSPDALEGIPQLRGAKNQSNYGKPVPIVLGRHLFTPMYVGNPYSTIGGIDGEFQFFHALYLLGYGKLKVSDVKLGVIGDLASNKENIQDGYLVFDGDPFLGKPENPSDPDNPTLELVQTARESLLYPQAVVEEQLNIELSHPEGADPLNVVRFTAKNPQKVQIEITFPSGLVTYNSEGDKESASVSISLRWRVSRPDDSDYWKEFGRFGVDQSGISYNGLESTISKSKTKVMRFVAEHVFTSYSQVSDNFDTRVIELEIKRTNAQSSNAQVIDKVYLTAVRTWIFDNEKSKASGELMPQVPVIEKLRDRTARLGFMIKATPNTQGYLDALNCILESRCRTWNSATKKWSESDWDIENQQFVGNTETPSNNPAAVALKLLQSPSLSKKAYKDSMIDMDSFGEFYEWCEERGYSCNGILTISKRLDEVFALIASTGRATRILNGNKYGLLIDKPRDYPVMVLNSQNVLEASNQKGFDDLLNGFLIRYINENDGYQYTEEYIMADGSTKPDADSLIETLELPYITNRAQAVKMAWYHLACRYLRPEIWNRKVSVDGYLISIGDMVEIQDDTIAVGIGEGGIIQSLDIENNVITKIYTDGDFEVTDMTKAYGLKIMQADGVNPIKIRTVPVDGNDILTPGIYNDFTVNIPLTDPVVPHEGDIVAFGIFDKITTNAICFGKKGNGDGTFDLVFVPYQEGVYNTDTSKPIPPYEPNITTPQKLPPIHEIPPEQITKDDVVTISREITKEYAGEPATIYRLRPSVNVIKKNADGSVSPEKISCEQYFINQYGIPEESQKELRYITNLDNVEHEYDSPIDVNPELEYIIFLLYYAGILLDKEEIPVLVEDSDEIILDMNPDTETIACYFSGVPKQSRFPAEMRATLYLGLNEITEEYLKQQALEEYQRKWHEALEELNRALQSIFRKLIVLYPGSGGSIFNPLSGGYPVSLSTQIDKEQIFLYPDDMLPLITDLPKAKSYTLSEIKIPDITIDEYQMPEFSLENAPAGMMIDSNGTISISPDTVYDRLSTVIIAKAVFEGRTYSKPFTLIVIKDPDPGRWTPKYLGKTETVTYSNVVNILFTDDNSEDVAAREGDYISYVGESQPGASHWKKNYVLRWNGSGWVQLDPLSSDNTSFYMAALRDITDDAEIGVFSSILAKKIMALEATIEELQSKIITISNGGEIRSASVTNGERDFSIKSNGEAVFNKAIIRGHIEANSGSINSISITNVAINGGSLNIGPLCVSNEQTTPSQTMIFPADMLVEDFVNTFIPANPDDGKKNVITIPVFYGGSYGPYSLNSIIIEKESRNEGTYDHDNFVMRYTVKFITSNGNISIDDYTHYLRQQVVINGGGSGSTFKLTGLPSVPPSISGLLWFDRQSNAVYIVP